VTSAEHFRGWRRELRSRCVDTLSVLVNELLAALASKPWNKPALGSVDLHCGLNVDLHCGLNKVVVGCGI
jgi:hypothetical protein